MMLKRFSALLDEYRQAISRGGELVTEMYYRGRVNGMLDAVLYLDLELYDEMKNLHAEFTTKTTTCANTTSST